MTAIEIIGSGIIGLLLTVSGFFIVRYFNNQDKINERTSATFDKLSNSLNNLDKTLIVMQEHQKGFESGCKQRHEILNKELEAIKS